MAKIIVFAGPPCSGKSTYANKLLEKYPNTVRVNKDSYRYMFRNEGFCTSKLEKIIDSEQHDTIAKMLTNGFDVIVDNTHCKVSYLNKITDNYKDIADIHVILFETPLWLLKVRNIIRYFKKGIWIPVDVIERMHSNFKTVKKFVEENRYVDGNLPSNRTGLPISECTNKEAQQ